MAAFEAATLPHGSSFANPGRQTMTGNNGRVQLASMHLRAVLAACCCAILVPGCGGGSPESGIGDAIASIKAVDNHAHPLRAVNTGETDDEYDALNFRGPALSEPEIPFRLRQPSEYIPAWRDLYGFVYTDKEHFPELLAAKQRARLERGDAYPAWILDKLGVDTMLANRVAMGRGLGAPRFRWVSYVDTFMFPLNNGAFKRQNTDRQGYFASEELLMNRYLENLRMSALPATLDEYLARVVSATLESQKLNGVVAVKFEAAYLRRLGFADVPVAQARSVYATYVETTTVEPPTSDYTALQDYVFRYIVREAGRLGLVVHIHVGFGIGSFFDVAGSNPLLLEPVFNDPSLRQTRFVLIHGGWPFANQIAPLLLKPNVYADFSSMAFVLYPRELSGVIRGWLEVAPEKVMFGTDAIDVGKEASGVGWEELCWIGTTTSREALALALTGMMTDGEISRDRAIGMARDVLRDNAIALYGLTR